MQGTTSQDSTLSSASLGRVWRRSTSLVYSLITLTAGIALLSWAMLIYQGIFHRDEWGIPFHAYRGAWMHLLGHLLRAAGLTWVTWCLWQYVRLVSQIRPEANTDWNLLGERLRRVWLSLSGLCWGLAIYAISYLSFAEYPPYPPDDDFDSYYQKREEFASGVSKGDSAAEANRIEFRLASQAAHPGWEQLTSQSWPEPVFQSPDLLLTAQDIQQANIGLDEREHLYLDLKFTNQAGQRNRTLTADYEGLLIVIHVDHQVVSINPLGYTLGSEARLTLPGKTLAEVQNIAEAIRGPVRKQSL